MATTFNWIYLGTAASIDPTEGNSNAENASILVGQTYGSTTAPLFDQGRTFSPGSTGYTGGANNWAYDTNNSTSTTEALGKPEYKRHKFPGITKSEVDMRIARFQAALGRFDGLAADLAPS